MLKRENLRVLVVDDQDSMRQLLCASLRTLGVNQVTTAEDGEKAVAQLRAKSIDLVLMDSEMPRMTGAEALMIIRNDQKLRATPVIMVTGRADAEFVQRAAKLGIDGYLVKPVSAAALAARIDVVLRKIA